MNPKMAKILAEYEKNKAKISELQSRQRELDHQRTELENNEILELVHSHKLDIDALAALLKNMKSGSAPIKKEENTLEN
ncbi:MAG: DUF4315 family protein [Oscillospiraceae bacterium]|jgi:Spy/CpxP family protein refolding chaperone